MSAGGGLGAKPPGKTKTNSISLIFPMANRFFAIPVHDHSDAKAQLNAFLGSHRVVAIDRRFVDQGVQSFWAICVDYIAGSPGKGGSNASRERVDYKEKLTPEEFRVFAQLRDLRKELAQAEAVPVYTIFSNDQLARMVTDRATTREALEKIDGVGDARGQVRSTVPGTADEAAGSASMKRTGGLFDAILEHDNLREAVYRALKGKRHRPEARDWTSNLDANTARIADQLRVGGFPFGRFHQFTIYDPKERLITAPCFEERVVHHAIINIVEPHLERWLINDTYACRKGKGRIACLSRARQFASANPWFLKLDIRKYFDSISHERLLELWQRRFKDDRLFALMSAIVRSYRGNLGKGLPIGSLTSQHLANFYLGWFDRFVKERLRIRGYVRYMDDMALWLPDSPTARGIEASAREFLAVELDLQPKADPYANRTAHGMDFLGCRLFPSHAVPNRRGRIRFRRKWRELANTYDQGAMSDREFQVRAMALVSFLRTDGVASCRFRRRTLLSESVGGREAPPG